MTGKTVEQGGLRVKWQARVDLLKHRWPVLAITALVPAVFLYTNLPANTVGTTGSQQASQTIPATNENLAKVSNIALSHPIPAEETDGTRTAATGENTPSLRSQTESAENEDANMLATQVAGADKNQSHIIEGRVLKNETFSDLLREKGVEMQTVSELVEATRPVFNLNRLKRGRPYKISLDSNNSLDFFDYKMSDDQRLHVAREGDAFKPELLTIDYDVELEIIQGTIQSSLIEAVLEAGGSYQTAAKLAEIFSWDIDFFKDLRKGDGFKLIVEKKYDAGEFSKEGRILAAIFNNNGRLFDAVYFENPKESGSYYTSEGKPLKKQFLKAPLKFSKISSGYTNKRFHPIYKSYLPHLSVDYSAPYGTPVFAVSDGTVLAAAESPRGGNHVVLQHNGVYTTTYSHFSSFARGIAKGAKVQQGQVLGYVGATGAATGPHLCFQIRTNGVPVNPLTFKSPGGPVISDKHREMFALVSTQKMKILNRSEVFAEASVQKTDRHKNSAEG